MKMTAKFISNTVPGDRLLPGIHGLRGIAALAVFLFHLIHITKISAPPFFNFIGADFGYGVHLFFILSAYSLMHSNEYTVQRPNWCKEYFIKRYWRIAPLFYVVLLLTVTDMAISGKRVSLDALFLNLTLLFGATPWIGIVIAGWSIGVEVLFYLIFPVLLILARTPRYLFALLLLSVPLSIAIRAALHVHYNHTGSLYGWNWSYFSFGSNLCFFVMGLYAFHLTQSFISKNRSLPKAIPLLTIAVLGLFIFTNIDEGLKGPARLDLIGWGLGFSTLCIWQAMKPSRWCKNSFFEYIGERSYSVYLLHPLILIGLREPTKNIYIVLSNYLGSYAFFICAVLVMAILMACAELTYRFIQLPGIRHGNKINKKISRASEAESPSKINARAPEISGPST